MWLEIQLLALAFPFCKVQWNHYMLQPEYCMEMDVNKGETLLEAWIQVKGCTSIAYYSISYALSVAGSKHTKYARN